MDVRIETTDLTPVPSSTGSVSSSVLSSVDDSEDVDFHHNSPISTSVQNNNNNSIINLNDESGSGGNAALHNGQYESSTIAAADNVIVNNPNTLVNVNSVSAERTSISNNTDAVTAVNGNNNAQVPMSNGKTVYEVEAILDKKIMRSRLHFFIKWKGWDIEESTWEPFEHLGDGCRHLVIEFERRRNLLNHHQLGSLPSSSSASTNHLDNQNNSNVQNIVDINNGNGSADQAASGSGRFIAGYGGMRIHDPYNSLRISNNFNSNNNYSNSNDPTESSSNLQGSEESADNKTATNPLMAMGKSVYDGLLVLKRKFFVSEPNSPTHKQPHKKRVVYDSSDEEQDALRDCEHDARAYRSDTGISFSNHYIEDGRGEAVADLAVVHSNNLPVIPFHEHRFPASLGEDARQRMHQFVTFFCYACNKLGSKRQLTFDCDFCTSAHHERCMSGKVDQYLVHAKKSAQNLLNSTAAIVSSGSTSSLISSDNNNSNIIGNETSVIVDINNPDGPVLPEAGSEESEDDDFQESTIRALVESRKQKRLFKCKNCQTDVTRCFVCMVMNKGAAKARLFRCRKCLRSAHFNCLFNYGIQLHERTKNIRRRRVDATLSDPFADPFANGFWDTLICWDCQMFDAMPEKLFAYRRLPQFGEPRPINPDTHFDDCSWCEYEFLTKFKSCSYWALRWTPGDLIKTISPLMLRGFHRRIDTISMDIDETALFDAYTRIDRVLNSERVKSPTGLFAIKCLIKWTNLTYEDNTYEVVHLGEEKFEELMKSRVEWLNRRRMDFIHPGQIREIEGDEQESPLEMVKSSLTKIQIKAFEWLLTNYSEAKSCAIANNVNIGKTTLVINTLKAIFDANQRFPFLILVPTVRAIDSWHQKLQYWCPDMNGVPYSGNNENRTIIRDFDVLFGDANLGKRPSMVTCHVLITTYETFVRDWNNIFGNVQWETVVIDSRSRTKSRPAPLTRALDKYRKCFYWILNIMGNAIDWDNEDGDDSEFVYNLLGLRNRKNDGLTARDRLRSSVLDEYDLDLDAESNHISPSVYNLVVPCSMEYDFKLFSQYKTELMDMRHVLMSDPSGLPRKTSLFDLVKKLQLIITKHHDESDMSSNVKYQTLLNLLKSTNERGSTTAVICEKRSVSLKLKELVDKHVSGVVFRDTEDSSQESKLSGIACCIFWDGNIIPEEYIRDPRFFKLPNNNCKEMTVCRLVYDGSIDEYHYPDNFINLNEDELDVLLQYSPSSPSYAPISSLAFTNMFDNSFASRFQGSLYCKFHPETASVDRLKSDSCEISKHPALYKRKQKIINECFWRHLLQIEVSASQSSHAIHSEAAVKRRARVTIKDSDDDDDDNDRDFVGLDDDEVQFMGENKVYETLDCVAFGSSGTEETPVKPQSAAAESKSDFQISEIDEVEDDDNDSYIDVEHGFGDELEDEQKSEKDEVDVQVLEQTTFKEVKANRGMPAFARRHSQQPRPSMAFDSISRDILKTTSFRKFPKAATPEVPMVLKLSPSAHSGRSLSHRHMHSSGTAHQLPHPFQNYHNQKLAREQQSKPKQTVYRIPKWNDPLVSDSQPPNNDIIFIDADHQNDGNSTGKTPQNSSPLHVSKKKTYRIPRWSDSFAENSPDSTNVQQQTQQEAEAQKSFINPDASDSGSINLLSSDNDGPATLAPPPPKSPIKKPKFRKPVWIDEDPITAESHIEPAQQNLAKTDLSSTVQDSGAPANSTVSDPPKPKKTTYRKPIWID